MAPSRRPGSLGRCMVEDKVDDGTLIRAKSPSPGPVRDTAETDEAKSVLVRIKRFRDFAESWGLFTNAIAALDHYLDRSGTFVEIPHSKVQSVRSSAEADHLQKARQKFQDAVLLEATAEWLNRGGYPRQGGRLSPVAVEFTLRYESGVEKAGLTDDNLTYYGSTIVSEVAFRVRQASFPAGLDDGPVQLEVSVLEWKSWVADNYDWEGDKQFASFIGKSVGLPSQKEMNSLQRHGLAKPYQRSSRSWQVTSHGMSRWTDTVASLQTMKEVAPSRIESKQRQERWRAEEISDGALPTPRPAEEVPFNVP